MTREVELGQEVGRKDHPTVAVDDERLHGSAPILWIGPSRCVRCGPRREVSRRRGRSWCGAGRAAFWASQARTAAPSLSRVGGAACAVRVTSWPAGSKNRSGGPASRSAAEGVVVDVDEQSLAAGLLPGVHLVDGADLPGRDADLVEPGEQVRRLPAGEDALDELDEPLAVGDAFPVGRQAGSGGVEVEAGTEPPPQPFAADRDLDEAVGAVEQPVGGDRGVVVALGAADLAGDRPAGRLEAVHPDDGGQQRGAHHRADSGAAAFERARPARRRRRTCRPAGRRSASRPSAGRPGPEPVSDISPASPCAIWS